MRTAEHSVRELGSRSARQRLPIQARPYFAHVADGLSIGYRRGKTGGSWIARSFDKEHGYRFSPLGKSNDLIESVGMTFQQAQDAARVWYGQIALADASGIHVGPYKVSDAATAWLAKWKGSARSKVTSLGNVTHHILPKLGHVELSKLTREMIEGWLHDLAQQPPVKVLQRQQSTKKLAPSRQSKIIYNPDDPETQRKRRDTANRVFNDLRALLSQAYMNDKVASEKAWKTVNKLEGTAKASSEGLTLEEAKHFIDSCPSDFLILVQAALITGCRYDDLCKMKVRAYVPRLHAVEVKQSKTGEMQRSYLSDDEEAFFIKNTSGKQADDHIFLRSDGEPWGKSHQQERMKDALKAAKINRHIRFHDLRHTLGQWLAESGMDMKVISKQLGHSSVRVTEKHYVQYTPEFLAKTVRENKPSFLSNV
jgi:integrase